MDPPKQGDGSRTRYGCGSLRTEPAPPPGQLVTSPPSAPRTPTASAPSSATPAPSSAPSTATPAPSSACPAAGTYLTAIKTGQHAGFDRVVFEFSGGLPAYTASVVQVTEPGGRVDTLTGTRPVTVPGPWVITKITYGTVPAGT
jgi:hypothetical protein